MSHQPPDGVKGLVDRAPQLGETLADGPRTMAPPLPAALQPALPFTLDLSAARVCLQLRDAATGVLRVPLVALEAPLQARPRGPDEAAALARPLRTTLHRLVVAVDEPELVRLLRPHGVAVRLRSDGARLTWSTGGVRVTARARLFPQDDALPTGPGALLSLDDVRVYGPAPRSWPSLIAERLAELPPWLAPLGGRLGGTIATLDVVRGALRHVLPPAGWKLPDSSRATVVALEHSDGQVTVELGQGSVLRPVIPSSSAGRSLQRALDRLELKRANAEVEAAAAGANRGRAIALLRRRLEAGADGGPYVAGRFLQVAIAEPVLHGQCRALAEERVAADPDDSLAWAVLLAIFEQAGDAAAATGAALRLVTIAEEEGEPFELVAAACAAARVVGSPGAPHVSDALRRAAQRCPDEPELLRELASAASRAGEDALSREVRERLLLADLAPREASDIALELGREALGAGHLGAAGAYVEFARARTPDDAGAHLLAAQVAMATGDRAAERAALERLTAPAVAMERPEVAARAWHRLAAMAAPEEAVALAHRAHALVPTDPGFAAALAEARERVGDVAGAVALWSRLAAAGDPAVEARATIHIAALAAADRTLRDSARLRLERLLQASPANVEALDALALVAGDDWEPVLAAFERGAQAARGATAARLHQVVGLLREDRLGLLHDAVDAYESAIAADVDGTESAVAAERLGRLYERLERWEALAALLARAGQLAPPDQRTAARLRLAHLLAGPLQRPDEALSHLVALLREHPRDLAVLRAAATLLRTAVGDRIVADTRLRALLRLAALAPEDEREAAAIEAAALLESRGDRAEARAVLTQVGPGRPRIARALERLSPTPPPARHEDTIAALAPRVLCEAPDAEAAALLCELLAATGRDDELAAVRAHLAVGAAR